MKERKKQRVGASLHQETHLKSAANIVLTAPKLERSSSRSSFSGPAAYKKNITGEQKKNQKLQPQVWFKVIWKQQTVECFFKHLAIYKVKLCFTKQCHNMVLYSTNLRSSCIILMPILWIRQDIIGKCNFLKHICCNRIIWVLIRMVPE